MTIKYDANQVAVLLTGKLAENPHQKGCIAYSDYIKFHIMQALKEAYRAGYNKARQRKSP